MPALEQGRIVWAVVPDRQRRNDKARPLIILTENPNELADADELIVVAVTTQGGQAPREDEIPLQWSRDGASRTKLTERSVAVCSWLCKIRKDSIRTTGGFVPPKDLKAIIERIAALQDDESARPSPE